MRQTCMFLSTIVSKASMAGVSSVTLMTWLEEVLAQSDRLPLLRPEQVHVLRQPANTLTLRHLHKHTTNRTAADTQTGQSESEAVEQVDIVC